MKELVVISGTGGTGKTSIVSAFAALAGGAVLPDCDVYAADLHMDLHPEQGWDHELSRRRRAIIDPEACTACGRCAEVCQYNAIAALPNTVLVFPEICHGCGSCALNCPTGAVREVPQIIGSLERGWAGQLEFAQGTMDVGQALPVPIIRQLKHWMSTDHLGRCDQVCRPVILDAPPGTACPVVATMSGTDAVLLVTEPTPFGLHDLRLAVQVARDELGLPVGVVVNRDGIGDAGVDEYCTAEEIPVLMRIPLDRRIAEAISEGQALVEALPE